VINALLACLEDERKLIIQSALDFMISHLSISGDFLSENEKIILVQGMLCLYLNKDNSSLIRRMNIWFFGKPNEGNVYVLNDLNRYFFQNMCKERIGQIWI